MLCHLADMLATQGNRCQVSQSVSASPFLISSIPSPPFVRILSSSSPSSSFFLFSGADFCQKLGFPVSLPQQQQEQAASLTAQLSPELILLSSSSSLSPSSRETSQTNESTSDSVSPSSSHESSPPPCFDLALAAKSTIISPSSRGQSRGQSTTSDHDSRSVSFWSRWRPFIIFFSPIAAVFFILFFFCKSKMGMSVFGS